MKEGRRGGCIATGEQEIIQRKRVQGTDRAYGTVEAEGGALAVSANGCPERVVRWSGARASAGPRLHLRSRSMHIPEIQRRSALLLDPWPSSSNAAAPPSSEAMLRHEDAFPVGQRHARRNGGHTGRDAPPPPHLTPPFRLPPPPAT
ncbi:hypothetical protein MRX96_010410 [Rhipicephalus microplus]